MSTAEQLESGSKNCSHCAEEIKTEAIVCKHCGADAVEMEYKTVKALVMKKAAIKNMEEKGWILVGEDNNNFAGSSLGSQLRFKRPKKGQSLSETFGGLVVLVVIIMSLFYFCSGNEESHKKIAGKAPATVNATVKNEDDVKVERNPPPVKKKFGSLYEQWAYNSKRYGKVAKAEFENIMKRNGAGRDVNLYYINTNEKFQYLKCVTSVGHCGIFQVVDKPDGGFVFHWVNGNAQSQKVKGIIRSPDKHNIEQVFADSLTIDEVYNANTRGVIGETFPGSDALLKSEPTMKWLFITVPLQQWVKTSKTDQRVFINSWAQNLKQVFPKKSLTIKVSVGANNGSELADADWSPFKAKPEIKLRSR